MFLITRCDPSQSRVRIFVHDWVYENFIIRDPGGVRGSALFRRGGVVFNVHEHHPILGTIST